MNPMPRQMSRPSYRAIEAYASFDTDVDENVGSRARAQDDGLSPLEQSIASFVQEQMMLVVADDRGALLTLSRKFCELSQLSEDEISAQGLLFHNASAQSSSFLHDLRPIGQNEQRWQGEFYIYDSSKKKIYLDSTVMTLFDSEGIARLCVSLHQEKDSPVNHGSFSPDSEAHQSAPDDCKELLRKEQYIEQERSRIARDLHDELGQYLLTLKNDIGRLSKQLTQNPLKNNNSSNNQPSLFGQSVSLLSLVDASLVSLKSVVRGLGHPQLEHGLIAAMTWLTHRFERSTNLTCEFMYAGGEPMLDDDQKLTLFRIVQEALLNIEKHAHASAIMIALRLEKQVLQLEVIDNGVGIASHCPFKPNVFGLQGMYERVREYGGHLTLSNIALGKDCEAARVGSASFDLEPAFKTGTRLLVVMPF